MARHHLAAALAALSLPAIAVPVAASPPPAAAVAPPAPAPTPPSAASAPAPAPPAADPAAPVAEPPVAEPPAVAAPADAAPPSPDTVCGIRVVRAPADIRDQLEAQLEADGAACQGALDVWLVPSSGGIYVQARDRAGRVRERQVPDAAIAATLIASWVEIDTAAPLWAPTALAAPTAPAVAADAPAPAALLAAPPSQSAVAAMPAVIARAPERRHHHRSVGVSAVAVVTGSGMEGGGLRVAFDALRWRRFDLGLAVQATAVGGDRSYSHPYSRDTDITEKARASGDLMATLRTRFRVGRLHLYPQVAIGAGVAKHQLWVWRWSANDEYRTWPTTAGVRAEAAIAASLALGRRWSVEAQAGTGFATYSHEDIGDPPPVWFDGINTALVGLRFTP